jgi:hypothetical protein
MKRERRLKDWVIGFGVGYFDNWLHGPTEWLGLPGLRTPELGTSPIQNLGLYPVLSDP